MTTPGNARQRILLAIKNSPGTTIAEISERLGFTYEAVRQQVTAMEKEGWIRAEQERAGRRTAGRPVARYRLTVAGEHLFPKHYDLLANTLIASAVKAVGPEALKSLLATITNEQVERWKPLLEGRSLEEKLELLKDLYQKEDPYTSVEIEGGEVRLVERNCPFLNTATEHPELCSVSVSTLARLLGFHVYREERFQSGHGRCVFRVDTSRPIEIDLGSGGFALEQP